MICIEKELPYDFQKKKVIITLYKLIFLKKSKKRVRAFHKESFRPILTLII